MVVVTRSQSSVAASTAAALMCTCKINKQPKSSTCSRSVNKTSKRAPSHSHPNPIHRFRSKLSKKILRNNNVSNTISFTGRKHDDVYSHYTYE
ncbi:unnamed protein product [Rotaria sp. Silwood1]|nr:unnamed protein product [Rotaria sp. Silwood1]CAF4867476.1 unnamed protein product [Rotaria sp. Silwood1]